MDPHIWLVNTLTDAEKYCKLNELETTGIVLNEVLLVLRAELAVLTKEKQSLFEQPQPKSICRIDRLA